MKSFRSVLALFMGCLFAMAAGAGPYSPSVLGLYKSSEGQTETENEIAYHLQPVLSVMGLKVRYHDADTGVPPDQAVEEARAVVSWFRGPSMESPREYLDFVGRTMEAGVKFLVLDNFGAYQDRSTGEWLESGVINLVFSRFGIQYWGDWTDDSDILKIMSSNPEVFDAGARAESDAPMLYYRFLPMDRDLRVHLAVRRTDMETPPSPVVVTNAGGGFALSSYVHGYLDLQAFAREALFGVPIHERVAVLTRAATPEVVELATNTLHVLRRGGLPVDVIQDAGRLVPGDLAPYTAVALALQDASDLDPEVIADYLDHDGSLLILHPGSLEKLAGVLDPLQYDGERRDLRGVRFSTGFLTNEGFFLEDRNLPWRSGALRPGPGAQVLASDWANTTPLLWRQKRKTGTVLVWNWEELSQPQHGGYIVESYLSSRPASAIVTPAMGGLRLDGFPRPLYNAPQGTLEVSDTEFYTTKWFPDMVEIAEQTGTAITASVLFNYNDRTGTPFTGGEFYMARGNAAVSTAREMLRGRMQVGLFGYNHIPLVLEASDATPRYWPNRDAMERALRGVATDWQVLFGAATLPTFYAAPYGLLSHEGVQALVRAFPGLRSLGTSTTTPGMGRFEPAVAGVYVLPHSSAGYLFSDAARRLMSSAVLGEGVWIHAIDADDVLDPGKTGGRSWKELLGELEAMYAFARRHYPWIRFGTMDDIRRELETLDGVDVEVRVTPDALEVRAAPGVYVRARTAGSDFARISGAEEVYRYRRSNCIVLRMTDAVARIEIR